MASGLTRKTPIKRKRSKPRRVAAKCSVRGCKRRPESSELCHTHLMEKADELFSLLIRSRGLCEAAGTDSIECNGALQCAHVRSRRYHAIRWNPTNARSLCAAHHMYYTWHPLEWERWIGADEWQRLLTAALDGPPQDAGANVAILRRTLERLEVIA